MAGEEGLTISRRAPDPGVAAHDAYNVTLKPLIIRAALAALEPVAAGTRSDRRAAATFFARSRARHASRVRLLGSGFPGDSLVRGLAREAVMAVHLLDGRAKDLIRRARRVAVGRTAARARQVGP